MLDHLLKFFVTFLVIVEPVGVIPIFIAMTDGVSENERRRMARKGVLIVAGFARQYLRHRRAERGR